MASSPSGSGNVSVRFAVQDAEVVRKALESLGKDGQAALDRLNAAGKAPAAGLGAISAVMGDLKGKVTGFAQSIGLTGTGLIALGATGLVAAAAIGTVVSAFSRFKEGAAAASAYAREVKDGAEQSGLSIPVYQALLDLLQQHGVEAEKASSGLNKFATESAAAANATGNLFEKLKEIDPILARAFALASSQGERLLILMQALAKVGDDVAARNALANAAFGKGGAGTGTALAEIAKSGGSLDDIAARLQKIGIVIDKDVIEKQARLGVETERIAKQIERNWDQAYSNIWTWSKESFASFFGFKSALAFAEWVRNFTNSLRSDAPEPGLQAAKDAAAAERDGGTVPRITITPNDEYQRRQQAIAQLKVQIDEERERIGLLGELATKTQRLKLAEDEVTLALFLRKPITDADAAAIKRATEARLAAAETAKRVQFGVASEEERRANFVNDLNAAIAHGTVKETEREAAMNLYNKTLRETIEGEKVRASMSPQLTRLAIESGDLNKQLDAVGAQGTQAVAAGLTDITLSADHGVAAMERLKESLARMAIQMMFNATVGRVLATVLNGIMGAFAPAGAGAGAGTILPANAFVGPTAKGGVFGFGSGGAFTNGLFSSPTMFRFAAGGAWRNGVMGERGPEAVMPLVRGRDGNLGVRGGEGVTVVNNFKVENNGSAKVETSERKNETGGTDFLAIVRDANSTNISSGAHDSDMSRFGGRPTTVRR